MLFYQSADARFGTVMALYKWHNEKNEQCLIICRFLEDLPYSQKQESLYLSDVHVKSP